MTDEKQKILNELGGIPEEIYDELVKDFTQQLHGQIEEIDQAFASANYERVGRVAHSIKGVAANLRMSAIEVPARLLESLARIQSNTQEMIVPLDALKAAVRAIE